MSWKRTLYVLFVIVVAVSAAFTGALAGGIVVYQTMDRTQLTDPSASVQTISTSGTDSQPIIVDETDIQSTVTQAVQAVGPAVVTVVGTIPGQNTILGNTGDQTVSG